MTDARSCGAARYMHIAWAAGRCCRRPACLCSRGGRESLRECDERFESAWSVVGAMWLASQTRGSLLWRRPSPPVHARAMVSGATCEDTGGAMYFRR